VSIHAEPLPADIEGRLAGFTELVATAIANAQARMELRGYAEEQAALRRVATLVARAAPPQEVFAAVTAEVGRVLDAGVASMSRYDPDGAAMVLGLWTGTGTPLPVQIGTRVELGGRNVTTLVFHTRRPARIDDYADASGAWAAEVARKMGVRSSVGAPISVEGRLWGVMIVSSMREEPLAVQAEARLAAFTELVATAVANAQAQAALTASRARIVAAADTTRRRIERDLHDGAQQRLVCLALQLRTAQAAMPPELGELRAQLDFLATEATGTLDELRQLARGIHPPALARGGLCPALKALARRSAVPADLDIRVDGRLPEQIEIAAYYVVSEALTNAAKHAQASNVHIEVLIVEGDGDGVLRVRVRDDGRGGADLSGGSGLVGLKDRVEALGGALSVQTAPGAGSCVQAELPLRVGRAASG
jgi:signal transduction histidine kinase